MFTGVCVLEYPIRVEILTDVIRETMKKEMRNRKTKKDSR
jgi:hypothetical protein